jgi:peptidyl-prolyl cis-trans isomerase D
MFDLFRSRDKAVRIVLGGILVLVAVTMVVTLIPGFGSSTGGVSNDPVLAEVAGQKITASEAQAQFQVISQQAQISPSMMQVYFPQFLDSMIGQRAAVYYARNKMGLTVSDQEVLTAVMSVNPQFFQNGVLTNQAQFEQYIASTQNQTVDQYLDNMRDQLIMKKLQDSVLQGIVVTPAEIKDAYIKKYERAKIQYIAFPAAKFMDQVKPTAEELQKYFNSHRDEYIDPAKSDFQVVVLDQDKLEKTITVSDAQLHQAYSDSLDNFRTPERIHVRHILLKTDGKTDAQKAALKAKAEDLLKQLKSGADFAALAKKNSDDTASAVKGGDLGWIVRGQTVPEFESAAFALQPNQLSSVVTSQYGYHIIQVLEKQPARLKTFDEVKDELTTELRKQAVTDKMEKVGDEIHDALVKDPTSAAAVAAKYGADLVAVPDGKAGDAIPTLGKAPEIDNALALMKPNDVSSELVLPANRLAVVVLKARVAAHRAEYSEVADQVRQKYVLDQANLLAQKAAADAAAKLQQGADLEELAKELKLDVTTSMFFGRADAVEGLGSAAYVEDAFTKPVGAVEGPVTIQGRPVVWKVIDKMKADLAAMGAEREALLTSIKQKKASERNSLLLDSILTMLVKDGKVKRYPENVQHLMATYATPQ